MFRAGGEKRSRVGWRVDVILILDPLEQSRKMVDGGGDGLWMLAADCFSFGQEQSGSKLQSCEAGESKCWSFLGRLGC